MKLKVCGKFDYGPRFKVGDIVEIDGIKASSASGGFSVRVVGVWKNPRWFSVMWFYDDKKQQIANVFEK